MWRRGIATGLLVVLAWTGQALAWPGRSCMCSGEQPPQIGPVRLTNDLEFLSRANTYQKSQVDLELAEQNLANARMQARLMEEQQAAQVSQRRLADAQRIGVYIAGGTAVYLVVEKTAGDWVQYCERVEGAGHETWVCPF